MNKCLFIIKTAVILLIILAVGWCADIGSQRASCAEFCYFNPDFLQTNLGALKREMDMFFSKTGCSMSFQPFAHQVDFDRKLRKKCPAFVFVPEWYVQAYGNKFSFKAFLTPLRSGKTAYRKILMVAKTSEIRVEAPGDASLAMTSMGPESEIILNEILFSAKRADARDISTVMVPKDTDALFALALGQVDMALVVKENLHQIEKINPRILKTVRPLAESSPIPMPVICYSKGEASSSEVQKLKEVFLNADKKTIRVNIMEMLQIDEWKALSD